MAKTNQCDYCGSKFGLTRNYYRYKAFCTKQCIKDYQLGKPLNQGELPFDKPPEDELVKLLRYP